MSSYIIILFIYIEIQGIKRNKTSFGVKNNKFDFGHIEFDVPTNYIWEMPCHHPE